MPSSTKDTLPVVDDDKCRKAYRAYIECDVCGQEHPTFRCSRCRSSFYCSVECQRHDWKGSHKSECSCQLPTAPRQHDTPVSAKNTACGICWDEPIAKPEILPDCQHAFCFQCLQNWQVDFRQESKSMMDHVRHGRDSSDGNKTCPLCRKEIKLSIVYDSFVRACELCSQAQWTPPSVTTADEVPCERANLFRLALTELDKVLETNPDDLDALTIQSDVLLHVDPVQAIQVAHKILELHRAGTQAWRTVDDKVEAARRAAAAGNYALEQKLYDEMEAHYGTVEPWPQYLGEGPKSRFATRVVLAEAYEATQQWTKAYGEYQDIALWFQQNGPESCGADDTSEIYTCVMGSARCWFQWKQYENAMTCVEQGILLSRHYPGGHRLMAQIQRAMAQRAAATDQRVAPSAVATREPCTMMDAVRTMYRGIVYETPWGDKANEQANRLFLQDLLAEVGNTIT